MAVANLPFINPQSKAPPPPEKKPSAQQSSSGPMTRTVFTGELPKSDSTQQPPKTSSTSSSSSRRRSSSTQQSSSGPMTRTVFTGELPKSESKPSTQTPPPPTPSKPKVEQLPPPSSTPSSTIVIGVGKDQEGNVQVENIGRGLSAEDKRSISTFADTEGRLRTTRTDEGYSFEPFPSSTNQPLIKKDSIDLSLTGNLKTIKDETGRVIGYEDPTSEQSVLLTTGESVKKETRLTRAKSFIKSFFTPKDVPFDDLKYQSTQTSSPDLTSFFFPEKEKKPSFNTPDGLLSVASDSSDTRSEFQRMKDVLKYKLFTQGDTEPLSPKEIFYTVPVALVGAATVVKGVGTGFIRTAGQTIKGLTVDLPETVMSVVQVGADLVTRKTTPLRVVETSYRAASASFFDNPAEFAGGTLFALAGPRVIKGGVKSVRTRYNIFADKNFASRPFYVEELPAGYEPHKGSFNQFVLRYKGESFQRRGQTFGVRRVEKPTLTSPSSWVDALKGRKPGQIKYFDPIAEDILLRDTPSEFATSSQELSLAGKTQTVFSTSPDSSFLKKGSYTVLPGGGKELATLSGRAGVGGSELAQFFAPPTIRSVADFPSGTPQSYLFYSGLKPSGYSGKIPTEFKLIKPSPGIIAQKVITPEFPRTITKPYAELAQDLAGYTKPGSYQLSASTLKGVRTESEILKSAQTLSNVREIPSVNIPGFGNLKFFYSRDVSLGKGATIKALDKNIEFLNKRIADVESIVAKDPSKASLGQVIIDRELRNIARVETAKAELLSTSRGVSVRSAEPLVSDLSSSRSSSLIDSMGVSVRSAESLVNDIPSASSTYVPVRYISASDVALSTTSKASPISLLTTRSLPKVSSSRTSVVNTLSASSSFSFSDSGPRSSVSLPSLSPSKSLLSVSVSPPSSSSPPLISSGGASRSSSRRGSSGKPSPPSPSPLTPSPGRPSSPSPGVPSPRKPSVSPPPPPSFTPSSIISPFPQFQKSKKTTGGYTVIIGKEGNKIFKRLSARDLKEATSLGKGKTLSTAAASFEIRKNGQSLTDEELLLVEQELGRSFRRGKQREVAGGKSYVGRQKSTRFVQKIETRISSSGEKRDIRPLKGKTLSPERARSLVDKGVRLRSIRNKGLI